MVSDSGLVVIGAGLPRTGTNSLQLALQKLLGGPCYHMRTVFASKGSTDSDFWARAIRQNVTDEEFRQFLEDTKNCRSAVDYPPSFYWKKLIRIFPDAKVILSVRNPETWRKSVQDSIMLSVESARTFPISWVKHLIGLAGKLQVPYEVINAVPDGYKYSLKDVIKAGDKESQEFFNKWKEEVIAIVPPERLLIFEAKQGWEPLCKFLDVPVPKDEPYPRVNDSQAFRANITKRNTMAYAIVFGIPVVAGVIISWAMGLF